MAKDRSSYRSKGRSGPAARATAAAVRSPGAKRFCTLREGPPPQFAPSVAGERVRLIVMNSEVVPVFWTGG